MKSTFIQFKVIIVFLSLFFGTNMYSQNNLKDKKMFVRVFNHEGKKIGRGYVAVATDSTLELTRSMEYAIISLKDIDYLKTKRSTGNNMLIGSIAGATTMGILGAATADPDAWIFSYTPAEGAAAGIVIGGLGGGILGGISSVFKSSMIFEINGNKEKWELFKTAINQKTSQ